MKKNRFEKWLQECGYQDIQVGMLTLFEQPFMAARFRQFLGDQPRQQTAKAPLLERFICHGQVPGNYLNDPKVCFKLPGDKREWYVCGYILERDINNRNANFHPFGATFKLAPWDAGGKIDDEELNGKYRRMPIEWLVT